VAEKQMFGKSRSSLTAGTYRVIPQKQVIAKASGRWVPLMIEKARLTPGRYL
jgi:hypothetical protein